MDPSPPNSETNANLKARLRKHYRALRREHVASLPDRMRALLFLRPPAPLVSLIPEDACVALYHPHPNEAPTQAYAQWLHEHGRRLALPYFADRSAPMAFRALPDPHVMSALAPGPFGVSQPPEDATEVTPQVLLVPLLAFTADGTRLGQGGGHYDRWLADHPDALAIGLAWDCQLAEHLPAEAHDRRLSAVVTPTRMYEGQD
ncbi:5-formyltetrahydrofolate cyclo-ligase [Novosphingobium sp. M1R2S20]|uniref:5-formyltetrahydrofolate cyclo-ligase n=1 Tax=Novosphingobium rhizovicinum TaxID=3228928 RepID=A0ABV3RGI5_9SPHN